MTDEAYTQKIKDHWEREDLSEAIRSALIESGKNLDALTLDDLAPLDQFHGGGKGFTQRLAKLSNLQPAMHILDVGGGLGGPARTLALEFGCRVTVVDLTKSYIHAGRMLTALMKLENHVTFQVGDALELSFDDNSFDAVWTQNSGMNIADKERLYAGFQRLIRPNGLLVIQEPVSGPNQPAIFPTMWSRDGSNHFVRKPEQLQATIEAAGFQLIQWDNVTHVKDESNAVRPTYSIQKLVMGTELLAEITRASKRNADEERMGMVQAVFKRL
ncbi:MAG: methyltransferase domain-containing protein [Chloroflexota bacterium]